MRQQRRPSSFSGIPSQYPLLKHRFSNDLLLRGE